MSQPLVTPGLTTHRPSLPVAITRGMPVVDINDGILGNIVGITQAYCVYRIADSTTLVVARWHDVALGNLCPAAALLPNDVTENDCRNARAAVLRELLALRQFGLSEAQSSVLDQLVTELTDA